MTLKKLTGSEAIIQTEAENDIKIDGSQVRLNCRPSYNAASSLLNVIDGNYVIPTLDINNNICTNVIDKVNNKYISLERCLINTTTSFATGDERSIYARSTASTTRIPNSEQLFTSSWTIDILLNCAWTTASGVLFSCYFDGGNVGPYFDCSYGGKKITFNISNKDFSIAQTLELDLTSANPQVSDIWLIRLCYDHVTPSIKVGAKRLSDGTVLSTTTSTDVPTLEPPDVEYRYQDLASPGYFNYNSVQGTIISSGIIASIQRIFVYDSDIGVASLPDISARPTYYAATTGVNAGGVSLVFLFQGELDDVLWDTNTLITDYSSFASAIGAAGWTIFYKVSNTAPGYYADWSEEYTLDGFKALGNLEGKYLAIGLKCKTDEYTGYYPINYMGINQTLNMNTGTKNLTFQNFTREGNTGSVTIDIQPGLEHVDIYALSYTQIGSTQVRLYLVGEKDGYGTVDLDFSSIPDTEFVGSSLVSPADIIVCGRFSNGEKVLSPYTSPGFIDIYKTVPEYTYEIGDGVITFTVDQGENEGLWVFYPYPNEFGLALGYIRGPGDLELYYNDGTYTFIPFNEAGQIGIPGIVCLGGTVNSPRIISAENDGTGNSITLTLENDVALPTHIYYRKLSDRNTTTWTDFGVTASNTIQVTGLEDFTMYQFISGEIHYWVPINCFCASDAPLIEKINMNILDALKTITIENGCYNSISRVERVQAPGFEYLKEFPGIVFYETAPAETADDTTPYESTSKNYYIAIDLWLNKNMTSHYGLETTLNYMQADLESVIMEDYSRGGAAITTHIDGWERLVGKDIEPYAMLRCKLRIPFIHKIGNTYLRR